MQLGFARQNHPHFLEFQWRVSDWWIDLHSVVHINHKYLHIGSELPSNGLLLKFTSGLSSMATSCCMPDNLNASWITIKFIQRDMGNLLCMQLCIVFMHVPCLPYAPNLYMWLCVCTGCDSVGHVNITIGTLVVQIQGKGLDQMLKAFFAMFDQQ